jgi:hypothetical protein
MARRTTVDVLAGDTLVTAGGGPRALFLLLHGLAVLQDSMGSTVCVSAWPSFNLQALNRLLSCESIEAAGASPATEAYFRTQAMPCGFHVEHYLIAGRSLWGS